jgi:Ribbon-helix-helix protein, copG family.
MKAPVKRSMYFPAPQMEFLREEAERLGITVSALIIRIIDAYRENR